MPGNAVQYLPVLLSASWLNTLLYMLEIVLVVLYFYRFSGGSRYLHTLISVMLLADTAGTIAVYSSTWLNLITRKDTGPRWGDLWTLSMMLIATSLAALCEQTFLIYRFFTLSNAKKTSICLVLLALTHATIMTYTAILICIRPILPGSPATKAFMVGSCLSALVDLTIPIVLYCQLRKISSSFKSTQSLVMRVSMQALSSGAVVAVLGLVCAILFWLMRIEFVIFFACLGRVYAMTVLFNLLRRNTRHSNISAGRPAGFRTKVPGLECSRGERSTSINLEEFRPGTSNGKKKTLPDIDNTKQNNRISCIDLPKV
ncbi:hypothetical protein BDZ94DRAFT_1247602 [Collybia nuda]|uniref:DUF6534 domain-containing protein n=1 Tax=Collybia nuda TaxID=64659 RepID=A0A9P6CIU1_9AGAR|nr:hypothetical protein BDZ94DRAFT_1247602 [Collybia nuda]